MAGKREQALSAIQDILEGLALSDLDVGERNRSIPNHLKDKDLVILSDGDIQNAEPILSPLRYFVEWAADIEIFTKRRSGQDPEERLDAYIQAIGTALVQDRTLGGVLENLSIETITRADEILEGSDKMLGAAMTVTIEYETTEFVN